VGDCFQNSLNNRKRYGPDTFAALYHSLKKFVLWRVLNVYTPCCSTLRTTGFACSFPLSSALEVSSLVLDSDTGSALFGSASGCASGSETLESCRMSEVAAFVPTVSPPAGWVSSLGTAESWLWDSSLSCLVASRELVSVGGFASEMDESGGKGSSAGSIGE